MEEGRPNIVKILLVEDSRTLRLSNERALLKAGYDEQFVSCACSVSRSGSFECRHFFARIGEKGTPRS
jgi:hypothetical protein